MDYKPLPVGVDIFEKLITQEYYFIDKTLLIKDLLDKKGDVNLFTTGIYLRVLILCRQEKNTFPIWDSIR